LALGVAACHHEEPEVKVRRTVLVYIEGRNNLSGNAYSDLAEMRRGEIPADGRLLVYRSIRGEDHPTLMEVYAGGDSVLADYPAETSAVDPAQMRRVLADARRLAPSDELGMILWSHSSGWRQKSVPLSRGYGLEDSWKQMSVTDLAATLEDQGLDFIFFDSCFMGSVEVAYELRNAAPRMVASVCEVPSDGMPYHLTLKHLFDPDIDAGLAAAIDATVELYSDSPLTSCPSTLSLIDLTRVGEVVDVLRPVINNPLPEGTYQRFATSPTYRDLFFDLGQYIDSLGGNSDILDRIVLHERHTPYPIWDVMPLLYCSGLTVGIPSMNPDAYLKHDYYTLSWPQALNINP